jgi:hypothetical protein
MAKIGTSQNGWPVYTTTEHFVRFTVEGRGFWAANEDVAVVAKDFIQWFHDNIESINLPVKEAPGFDDWSYAVRPVRGQTTGYSNHASDTAWDINSTRHPRGVKNTYTKAQRAKLKAKIATYEGVLRHGEFYTSTIDGMHVEINASPAAVARMAETIRRRNAKPPVKPADTEDDDMKWDDPTKLTATDAAILGGKAGDARSISSQIRYPPGVERVRKEQKAQFDALTRQIAGLTAALTTLNGVVGAMAKNSAPAVKAAFDAGIAGLKAELANIDITVSIDDTPDG